MNIIFLPTCDELAYNLNKAPKEKEEYKKFINSLASSVLDYSNQIQQLFEKDGDDENERQTIP